jgi:hypothetical protein
MSDLDRYRRDQDEFFRLIEEERSDADARRWIAECKARGGRPAAIRSFFNWYLKILVDRKGMSDASAREKALIGVASAFEMDVDALRGILRNM